jgi:hypothetical protein
MSNRAPLLDSEIVKRLIPEEDIKNGYILMELKEITGLYFRRKNGGGNIIVVINGNDPISVLEGNSDDVIIAGFVAFANLPPRDTRLMS